jgi:hypothetical protein
MSVFMQPIFTQTVGAGGIGSITFNNIPQGYTDLVLEISARTGNANIIQPIYLQVNGAGQPSGTHATNRVLATGSTTTASRDFGYTGDFLYGGYMIPDTSATANTFSNARVTIRNYASASFKPIEIEGIAESNVTTGIAITTTGATYLNTKPVTSIYIGMGNWTIAQGSTFTLYGLAQQYPTALPSAPSIGSVTDLGGFASVAFTPAVNDQATSYAVTGSDGVTTYGNFTPIVTPMTIGTATTYTAKAINSLGTSSSGSSTSVTTNNSYSSIASQTVGAGGATTVVFTNIPQNYSHLQIRMYGFAVNSDIGLQFNSDNSVSYSRHYHYGSGSAVTSSGTILGGNNWVEPLYVTGNTTYPASSVSDILDYSSTLKNKVMRTISGYDTGSAGYFILYSGLWTSLAPISSMTFFSNGSSLTNQYTTIAIYGMA